MKQDKDKKAKEETKVQLKKVYMRSLKNEQKLKAYLQNVKS
jgi:hypothetical protein